MSAPTVIFDCVTFLQALANQNGPAAKCWGYARNGRVSLHVCQPILDEVADVLRRPKLAQKFGFTEQIVQSFLEEIARIAVIVAKVPSQFSFARDPKDEPYINLALAIKASHIVTWDKDLLDLMDENSAVGQSLRTLHVDLVIMTPPAFLSAIESQTAIEGSP